MRKLAHLPLIILVLLSCPLLGTAEGAGVVTMTGRLAGRVIPGTGANPARLDTHRRVVLDLSVTNRGLQDVEVGTIVLRGRTLGLTFFNYETSVAIGVPAGSTVTRQFSLDLTSMRTQAVGLFNADVTLLDMGRHALVSRRSAVDVQGSPLSVYSLFGLALALATVAAFVRGIVDLAADRLSPNRWRRGVRFLVAGLGLGLTIVFTSSAMRILLPGPMTWMPLLLITSGAGFALGYFTPTPDGADGPRLVSSGAG